MCHRCIEQELRAGIMQRHIFSILQKEQRHLRQRLVWVTDSSPTRLPLTGLFCVFRCYLIIKVCKIVVVLPCVIIITPQILDYYKRTIYTGKKS